MITRILNLLSDRGITAKKLTEDLDISNSSVTDWKKGSKPSCDVIVKLSDYFGVTTDFLLKGTITAPRNNVLSSEDEEWLALLQKLPTGVKKKLKHEMEIVLKYSCDSDDNIKAQTQQAKK